MRCNKNYQITYEENPSSKDIQKLYDGISQQAQMKKAMKPIETFAFFLRDSDAEIVGGCSGCSMYGCLYIDSLWVNAALQGKGYGTQLMQRVETLAKENHCHFIAVNTFDWEALGFYKKLGFYVEFERKGFDKDSIFYFLRKN